MAEAVVAGMGKVRTPASVREIVAFLDARPDLVAINRDVVQKPGKPIRLKASA
jgi:hypothetical protein